MNKKRFAAMLLAALMSIGISGCGKANVSAPAADSETPSIAEQSSEQADILVTPEDLEGEGYKKYEGQMITVVGYPGFYIPFDSDEKLKTFGIEQLKALGSGALYVSSAWGIFGGAGAYCCFDDNQSESFNDDVCGEIRGDDKLIGITGLCSGANLTGCDPEYKTYNTADIPYYSNNSEVETGNDTDSEESKEETKTAKREMFSEDLSYLYSDDIQAVMDYTFLLNEGEEQPYIIFNCSTSPGVVQRSYTYYLKAGDGKKQYTSYWITTGYNTSYQDASAISFLDEDSARYWGKSYGTYIKEGAALLPITSIYYYGYESILE